MILGIKHTLDPKPFMAEPASMFESIPDHNSPSWQVQLTRKSGMKPRVCTSPWLKFVMATPTCDLQCSNQPRHLNSIHPHLVVRRSTDGVCLVSTNLLGKAKVSHLAVALSVQQQVLRLEVSVDQAPGVQVLQGQQHIGSVEHGRGLVKGSRQVQMVKQLATCSKRGGGMTSVRQCGMEEGQRGLGLQRPQKELLSVNANQSLLCM